MNAADRLRSITAAVAERDAAAAAAADVDVTPDAEASGEMKRSTVDLELGEYLELQRWMLDAAESIGRGTLQQNDVLCAAVLATIRDETVGRRVRALLAKSAPRRTRPKGKRPDVRVSGPPDVLTS